MASWDDRQTWRARRDFEAGVTGEPTIEEAALAAAHDWQGRARREAAAILNRVGALTYEGAAYDSLVSLCAVAWLQGFNLGAHETLAEAEQAFQRLTDAL